MKKLEPKLLQNLRHLLVLLLLFLALPAMSETYYIDAVNGSDADSHDGKSTGAAWQHHPYMWLYNHNPSSDSTFNTDNSRTVHPYVHQAGDRFIFKGGVTWTFPSFVINIYLGQGGSSSTSDYYGVDKSWHTGSTWTRPIFDAGQYSFGYFWIHASYVTIDNIEMTGFHWGPADVSPTAPLALISIEDNEQIVIQNCYFHGWTHESFATFDAYGSGSKRPYIYDNLICCMGSTSGLNTGCAVTDCVFDGSASDGDSGMAVYCIPKAINCVVKNMSNGLLPNGQPCEVGGCVIGPINDSFDVNVYSTPGNPSSTLLHSGQHPNSIEPEGFAGVVRIHHNIIFDARGACILVGVGNPSYVYENLIYNSLPVPITSDARDYTSTTGPGTLHCYNNTIVAHPGTTDPAIRDLLPSSGTVTKFNLNAENNHFIGFPTGGGVITSSDFGSSSTIGNNLEETVSAATTAGYTIANLWKPTSSTSPTVGTTSLHGADLSSLSTTLPSIGADLLNVSRSVGTYWDIGAYEFDEGVAPATAADLINIDFGGGDSGTTEVGQAATGVASTDFWNFYTDSDGAGGQRYGGPLDALDSPLKFANATTSSAHLTVDNAPGCWGTSSSDPMYDSYLYPWDDGNITVTLTGLAAGDYDFYVYGHGAADDQNSRFQLSVDSVDYGSRVNTTAASAWTSSTWAEGIQYVRFTSVHITSSGQTVTITVSPEASSYAILAGLQIVKRGAGYGPPSLPVSTFIPPSPAVDLIDIDFGGGDSGTTKVGLAGTIGKISTDFWNFYTDSNGGGGQRYGGTVTPLKSSAQEILPSASLTVANAPGCWGTGVSGMDTMYDSYLYPWDSGSITMTLTGLGAGDYDIYVYGHGAANNQNSTYHLTVDSTDYGSHTTDTTSGWSSTTLVEGTHYVRFASVHIAGNSQTVTILVSPQASSYAIIAGLQILKVP